MLSAAGNAAEVRPARVDSRWLVLLLVLTGALRFAAMSAYREKLLADPDGYRDIASRIALSFDNFSSLGPRGLEYSSSSGQVAYRPPLYPWLLALTGGNSIDHLGLVMRLHVLLGVLTVWLTGRLGCKLGLGNWSLLAASLVAVDPILVHQSTVVMTETLATCLAVAALDSLTGLLVKPNNFRAVVAGLLLGACCLCRPTFLVFAALAALALAWLLRRPLPELPSPKRARCALATLAALVLVVGAWGYRNYRHLGSPVFGTTHGGYTLLLANNSLYYAHLRGEHSNEPFNATALDPTTQSNWTRAQFEYFSDQYAIFGSRMRGAQNAPPSVMPMELRVDRLSYASAREAIAEDHTGFLRACLYRVRRFWGLVPYEPADQPALRYAIGVWYAALFALALVGFWQLGRTRRLWQTPWLFGLLLVGTFMAIHTVYWTDMRMRAPVTPVVCLAAAVGVEWLAGRRRSAASLEKATT